MTKYVVCLWPHKGLGLGKFMVRVEITTFLGLGLHRHGYKKATLAVGREQEMNGLLCQSLTFF